MSWEYGHRDCEHGYCVCVQEWVWLWVSMVISVCDYSYHEWAWIGLFCEHTSMVMRECGCAWVWLSWVIVVIVWAQVWAVIVSEQSEHGYECAYASRGCGREHSGALGPAASLHVQPRATFVKHLEQTLPPSLLVALYIFFFKKFFFHFQLTFSIILY